MSLYFVAPMSFKKKNLNKHGEDLGLSSNAKESLRGKRTTTNSWKLESVPGLPAHFRREIEYMLMIREINQRTVADCPAEPKDIPETYEELQSAYIQVRQELNRLESRAKNMEDELVIREAMGEQCRYQLMRVLKAMGVDGVQDHRYFELLKEIDNEKTEEATVSDDEKTGVSKMADDEKTSQDLDVHKVYIGTVRKDTAYKIKVQLREEPSIWWVEGDTSKPFEEIFGTSTNKPNYKAFAVVFYCLFAANKQDDLSVTSDTIAEVLNKEGVGKSGNSLGVFLNRMRKRFLKGYPDLKRGKKAPHLFPKKYLSADSKKHFRWPGHVECVENTEEDLAKERDKEFEETTTPSWIPNDDSSDSLLVSANEAQGVIFDMCEYFGISIDDFYDNAKIAQTILKNAQFENRSPSQMLNPPESSFLEGVKASSRGLFPHAKALLEKSFTDRHSLLTAYHLSSVLYSLGEFTYSYDILANIKPEYFDTNPFNLCLIEFQLFESSFEHANYERSLSHLEAVMDNALLLYGQEQEAMMAIAWHFRFVCLARLHQKNLEHSDIEAVIRKAVSFFSQVNHSEDETIKYSKSAFENALYTYHNRDRFLHSMSDFPVPFIPFTQNRELYYKEMEQAKWGTESPDGLKTGDYAFTFFDSVHDFLYFSRHSCDATESYRMALEMNTSQNIDAEIQFLEKAYQLFKNPQSRKGKPGDYYWMMKTSLQLANAYYRKRKGVNVSSKEHDEYKRKEIIHLKDTWQKSRSKLARMYMTGASVRLGHRAPVDYKTTDGL